MSDPSGFNPDAALVGSVHDWLERVKRGYGRFAVAFEALGVEDTGDVANIDRAIFAQIEGMLREGCSAKSMHLKNIRLALQDAGVDLRPTASEAPSDAPARPPPSPPRRPRRRDTRTRTSSR